LSGGLISSLDKIVAQAKKSAKLETDYNTGRVQAEMMRSQYENQVVRVKNKRVHFRTVRWLVDGSRKVSRLGGEDIEAYKVASIAEGKSFNKFCETATLDDIRTLGVALQVSEDKIFLSGGHFDHDRHGENFHVLKIENDTEIEGVMYKNGDFVVTHYDLGAVNVELPTREERYLVGELIADSLTRTFTGGEDVRDVIVEELSKKINENDYGTGYLSSLLRGLLARGDFLTRMNREDVIEAEKLLLRLGVIDKDIFRALTSRLMIHLINGLKKRVYKI
jgi:hypothetical protein